MTQPEQILAALEEGGGRLLYQELLDALRARGHEPLGVVFDLERLGREGKLKQVDAGAGDRPWRAMWCDCCEPDCRYCDVGPAAVVLL